MTKEVEKKAPVGIYPKDFVSELMKNNLGPVVEVPCSYLKSFLSYLWESGDMDVINPVNEGVVMARAAGEYMGSGKIPVVAIQNSGLMNTLNALTSLHQMYDIPAFMMVTWRGEGGAGKDAPEHDITGENLLKYLETFEVPYEVANSETYKKQIKELAKKARETRKPVAMVIKKDTFAAYEAKNKPVQSSLEMTRYDAIEVIKKKVKDQKDVVMLSGTGFPARDSFNVEDTPDFYTMGSMGHVAGIGLSIARTNRDKKIVVLDGDGGALMHAGTFANVSLEDRNYKYVMLDNGLYESTGGQPAASQNVNFRDFARAFGMSYKEVDTKRRLGTVVGQILKKDEPVFLRVNIKPGDHAGVRVSDRYTCAEVTDRFMSALASERLK